LLPGGRGPEIADICVAAVVFPPLAKRRSISRANGKLGSGETLRVIVMFPDPSIVAVPKEAGFRTAAEGMVEMIPIGAFEHGETPI